MASSNLKKTRPGLSFYLPKQVAVELAISEHKRRWMNPNNILESVGYYRYFYGTLQSIVSDISESLKLPEDLIINEYESLLYSGATPDRAYVFGAGSPGLISLIPLDSEKPTQEDGILIRQLSNHYRKKKEDTRPQIIRRVRNEDWETWRWHVTEKLETLTMESRTFLQDQLLKDQRLHPDLYQGLAEFVSNMESEDKG
jgi:hypothetical protein